MELSQPDSMWPPDLRPQPHELHGLRPGSIVKLYARTGSAIWCRVAEHRRQEKVFVAEIEDTPCDGLRRGDKLTFTKADVWEVC
ncbi:hypothetical protein [Desulfatitalea alkaliphila]|uniref:Uncharacterized protein n=1 Tax=Desulfatitalea alkaliphila TaxID=2929485 RepID=A0AA41UK24_9BACT|nr:hypothetical protein [Desulfatitalea alkaliphila]MCJ8501027.1 hypothetical protein [Desulfatitalea alkaliphila]